MRYVIPEVVKPVNLNRPAVSVKRGRRTVALTPRTRRG
jgi:hypothetical protein